MKEQHVIETLHIKKQQILLATQVVKMIFKTTDDVRSLYDGYYTFIRFSQKPACNPCITFILHWLLHLINKRLFCNYYQVHYSLKDSFLHTVTQ